MIEVGKYYVQCKWELATPNIMHLSVVEIRDFDA